MKAVAFGSATRCGTTAFLVHGYVSPGTAMVWLDVWRSLRRILRPFDVGRAWGK